MKKSVFVKVTFGENDNCTRIIFDRKAKEERGHRTVKQFGCFGDQVAEDVQDVILGLLKPQAWEGSEDDVFLGGRVELEFNVTGEEEEYEVPEDWVPDGLKTVTVYTTPVEIVGAGEPAADTFTERAAKRRDSMKAEILKSKD